MEPPAALLCGHLAQAAGAPEVTASASLEKEMDEFVVFVGIIQVHYVQRAALDETHDGARESAPTGFTVECDGAVTVERSAAHQRELRIHLSADLSLVVCLRARVEARKGLGDALYCVQRARLGILGGIDAAVLSGPE